MLVFLPFAPPPKKDLPERISRALLLDSSKWSGVVVKVARCRPLSLHAKVTLKNCRGVERLKGKVCLYRFGLKSCI